ncbi:RarD [Roseibacterium elongatum DSM 19469]|uniref:RarD n=1 Tax=Roseicyclus elongatus DSM 19469 TaxID=1294273 RepID=W8S881_9RHOB|nr:RarD [Roseibacterium elongatum DSM 19469]
MAALVLACVIWGLSPLFYELLAHIPPQEVLAHRTVWSLIVFAGVLALQSRLREVPRALGGLRPALAVAAAAAMISINWFLFIFAIQAGRTVEASLGYYIFPLVAVLIGAVILREGLCRAQMLAVTLAASAVIVLTVGLGAAPWISLTLAVTFGIYGLLKRMVAAGPVVSVTAEVLILLPIAVAYLAWLGAGAGAFGQSLGDSLLLIASGPMTATPLILFSYATKRVAMATVGLVQYLNPTLQFATAALILGEVVTPWHMIAFPIIWVALAIYSWATLRQARAPR